MNHVARMAGRLWRHASAGVAVLLIAAALAIGYGLGRPASESEAAGGGHADAADGQAAPRMYTCSMHPSVRSEDPDAKCPICHMDLVPVGDQEDDSVAPGDGDRLTLSESAAARSRVETAPAERRFPAAEVRLYGKVTYDETSVARLTAYMPGRIERLFVNYVGVPVNKGEHLAELYSPDLIAAVEELRQARAAADQAGGGGDLLGETSRQTLKAAREKLRLLGLTEEQVRAAESGDLDSEAFTIYAPIGGIVTDLAAREGDYLDTGEPIATVADLSRLWLDLEAYESQLPLLRWGQRVRFEVEARPGEAFEGRIAFIEPVVDARMRTAAVRVAVDNPDRRLKPGMFASGVVRARLGTDGAVPSEELAGKWVSPMHPTVVKDEPGACDVCGMDLVPARSLGVVADDGRAEPPLVIPHSAVLFTGTRSVVYVEVPEAETPTYEAREVVLGSRAGDDHVVRSGLREGESVVVSGAFRIDSAMQIAAKPSMMSGRGEHVPESGSASDACSDAELEGGSAPADEGGVPERFVESLTPVYRAYLEAQQSLADDDAAGFREAAAALNGAVGGVDASELSGEARGVWRRARSGLRSIPGEAGIERAREGFEGVSEAVIALARRFGHRTGEAWHVAHCPMAFDGRGADWLQRGTEISNPYFGASMLRCGEIRESLSGLRGSNAEGDNVADDHDREAGS